MEVKISVYHIEHNGCGERAAVCWRYTCIALLLLFTSLHLWAVCASWTEVLIKVFSQRISGIWKNNLFA